MWTERRLIGKSKPKGEVSVPSGGCWQRGADVERAIARTPPNDNGFTRASDDFLATLARMAVAMNPRTASSDFAAYAAQLKDFSRLSAEQERELAWRVINDGDRDAKAIMIQSNLKLVIAIARRYANRGLPLSDLVQEGNIGLIRAVEGWPFERRRDPSSLTMVRRSTS